jgi:hypothetical protein
MKVFAVMAERVSAQKTCQDGQPLIKFLRANPIVGIFTEAFKFGVRRRAESNTDNQPPTREAVERSRFARDHPWSAPGERRDERAQPHSLRLCGNCRQGDPSIYKRNVGAPEDEEMVPKKETIPASILGVMRKQQ